MNPSHKPPSPSSVTPPAGLIHQPDVDVRSERDKDKRDENNSWERNRKSIRACAAQVNESCRDVFWTIFSHFSRHRVTQSNFPEKLKKKSCVLIWEQSLPPRTDVLMLLVFKPHYHPCKTTDISVRLWLPPLRSLPVCLSARDCPCVVFKLQGPI